MKCKVCNNKEAKGNTGLCDSCRLKQWRIDNPEKIKVYLKKTEEHRKELRLEYYSKNKKRLNELSSIWRKKVNYAYNNTPKIKFESKIRLKTRLKYPIDGQKCEFCNAPAVERHHTTTPMEVDEFAFVCKYHHNKIHGKRCVKLGAAE